MLGGGILVQAESSTFLANLLLGLKDVRQVPIRAGVMLARGSALTICFAFACVMFCEQAMAQTVDPAEQALYDEAADQLGLERDALQRLDLAASPADRGPLIEELLEIDGVGVALLERFGPVIDYAPRILDALGALPPDRLALSPSLGPQPDPYEGAIAELRAGLPTAHRVMAAGGASGQPTAPRPAPAPQGPVGAPQPAGGPQPVGAPQPEAGPQPGYTKIMSPFLDPAVWLAVAGVGSVALLFFVLWRRARSRQDHELFELAMTDELTRLANRRRLERDLEASSGNADGLAVAMIDIDLFKQLNDRCGHPAGDRVLRLSADTIAANVRSCDVVYRYGGEEFAVLLPGADPTDALAVLERVRLAIEAMDLSDIGESVTVSAGLALGSSAEANTTLQQADEALYVAKRSGRNRVVLAS